MSNSPIWPIDRTLSGASIQARVDMGAMAMKSYSAFPKFQHYWSLIIRLLDVIIRTLIGGSLTSLQRCSWCILQPQPTGLMCNWVFISKKREPQYFQQLILILTLNLIHKCQLRRRSHFSCGCHILRNPSWYTSTCHGVNAVLFF